MNYPTMSRTRSMSMDNKKLKIGNPTLEPNGHNGQMRRHRYLKVEASLINRHIIRLMLMGLVAFTVGILAGFNIKDIMIRTCGAVSNIKAPITDLVKLETDSSVREAAQAKPKGREIFTKLPDKFLKDVPMKPPALFYSLRPWRIIERGENVVKNEYPPFFLTILVKSAVAFATRRFQIRQSWGSMTDIEGNRIAVIFVVGLASSRTQQTRLQEENELYGDIIQGDVSDSYKSLPSKVLSGYQFVTEYMGNSSSFYVSTDDDCFINIPNTFEYFRNMEPDKSEAVHCGFLFDTKANRVTNMRSKWGVPEEIYPIRAYPKFCHGGMTILSFGMLRDIYRVSLVTNYTGFHLEDVLTNGILRERLQREDSIKPVNLRDRRTNRRLGLMWHLGYRKDRGEAFKGLWSSIRRKIAVYEGPLDPVQGYRATVTSLPTLEGKSTEETISYFENSVRKKRDMMV